VDKGHPGLDADRITPATWEKMPDGIQVWMRVSDGECRHPRSDALRAVE
jgi:hypothetical protein